MEPAHDEQHAHSGSTGSEPALRLRQDIVGFAVGAEAVGDDLEWNFGDVRQQRDSPMVVAVGPVPFLYSTLMVASLHSGRTSPPFHTWVMMP